MNPCECQLKRLEDLLDLSSLVATLDASTEQFGLNTNFFRCCDGAGSQVFAGRNDARLDSSKRCDITKRVLALKKFLIEFARYTESEDPLKTLQEIGEDSKIWDSEAERILHLKTSALYHVTKMDDQSWLWGLVFRWVWQYGYYVKLVPFMDAYHSRQELWLDEEILSVSGPRLLFVYGVDHLWDGPYVESLEKFVSFAEQCGFSILLHFLQRAKSTTEPKRLSKFKQRIVDLKSKDPLSLMTPFMRSRLQAMTGKEWKMDFAEKDPTDPVDLGF